MEKETNNKKSEKNKNSTPNPNKIKTKSNNSQNTRTKIKNKLMKKYDLSENEAEKVLIEIENRKSDHEISDDEVETVSNNNLSDFIKISSEDSLDSNQQKQKIREQQMKQQHLKIKEQQNKQQNQKTKEQNVDNLLKDIVPDYEKKVSVELKNVDLTFEVTTEKIDTIKEQFIRTLKRNKTKKRKIHALNNISFQIYQGEKVGIIGYNGAGKSTLLSVITGVYIPDDGTVETYGKISPLLSLGAGFDYNYSGRENIFLNGAVLGYEKQFLLDKLDEIIEFSELEEFIDLPIKNYSSGMLAKLGFSIATIVEPDILIIDEILGVGDVNFQKKSHDKIKSIMDGKTTVLLVSHSIPQIRELCDKAIWIDKGKVREIGEVNQVCDNYLKDAEKATKSQLANIKFN